MHEIGCTLCNGRTNKDGTPVLIVRNIMEYHGLPKIINDYQGLLGGSLGLTSGLSEAIRGLSERD